MVVGPVLELLRGEDHTRFHFHRGDLTGPGAREEGVLLCRAVFGYALSLSLSLHIHLLYLYSISFYLYLSESVADA